MASSRRRVGTHGETGRPPRCLGSVRKAPPHDQCQATVRVDHSSTCGKSAHQAVDVRQIGFQHFGETLGSESVSESEGYAGQARKELLGNDRSPLLDVAKAWFTLALWRFSHHPLSSASTGTGRDSLNRANRATILPRGLIRDPIPLPKMVGQERVPRFRRSRGRPSVTSLGGFSCA